MWSTTKLSAVIVIAMSFATSIAVAADAGMQYWLQLRGWQPWQPPSAGIVRSPGTAIRIARAIAVEEFGAGVTDEQNWLTRMQATLKNGVWEVTEPLPPNTIGGSCFTYIAQADARILGAHCTQ